MAKQQRLGTEALDDAGEAVELDPTKVHYPSPVTIRRPNPDGNGLGAAVEVQGAVSVMRASRTQKRFILTIARSPVKEENQYPIPVQNGDYSAAIRRGIPVVVPECVINALNDAVTVVDGMRVHSYPFSATPYSGDLPIGTEIDVQGRPVNREAGELPSAA